MTILSPMRPAAYAAYLAASIAGYATDNVAAGRWPVAGALERSQAEFDDLLPSGLGTPDHHLYEIVATADGATVGHLWFAAEARHGVRLAFVYDVEIGERHRRQGHARRAFQALEGLAAGLGLSGIGLHVFAHNLAAQALYRELGYAATGINMQKRLDVVDRGDPVG